MTLEFVFDEALKSYVAEFEATADFNLHLEREGKSGVLMVEQRGTTEGDAYAVTKVWQGFNAPPVFDCDFAAIVYPKYIRVRSEMPVNLGVVSY